MSILQIIILVFSLIIYVGRIFFGIFKHFSPFKFKDGSTCGSDNDYYDLPENKEEFNGANSLSSCENNENNNNNNNNSDNADVATTSQAQADSSDLTVANIIDERDLSLKKSKIKSHVPSSKESRARRLFKRVNFHSVTFFVYSRVVFCKKRMRT